MKKWLFIGLVLSSLCGFAQDIKSELQAINTYYAEHPNLAYSVTYTLFKDSTRSDILEQMKGRYAKAGNRSYFKGFSLENVCDGTHTVMVDHEEKVLIYDQPENPVAEMTQFLEPGVIDTVLSGYDEVRYSDVDAQTASITFVLPLTEIRTIQLWFDKQSHRVTRSRLTYREPLEIEDEVYTLPVLEVSYSNISTTIQENDQRFMVGNYLQSTEDPAPVSEYASYEFVNLKVQRDAPGF